MTTLDGPALRLTVYVGEGDTWHHRPLSSEIVHRARAAGLAGASVFRGIEGFGRSSVVHTSRLLSLSEDLPVAVVVVDTAERIEAFLPQVTELVSEGLVTVDDVRVVHHASRVATDADGATPEDTTGGTADGTTDRADGGR